jgi:uroporphyrinogen decarboxylase
MSNWYHHMLQSPETASRIPVWMMRQAGRYLPEYRAIRQQHDFLDMVYTPAIAAEVTCQPIERYGFDAAILFSDILVTAQALGMALRFSDGVGPQFDIPIRTGDDVARLQVVSGWLDPIYETVERVIARVSPQTAVIGFAGAPFTVASYMIEGRSSAQLPHTKRLMMTDTRLFETLLDHITDVTIAYLVGQCRAGVQALQLFDTWIGTLDWPSCERFSAHYIARIVRALREQGCDQPITVFGKQTSVFYPLYEAAGVDVISVDWNGDLGRMDAVLRRGMGLQGNLDPHYLYGSKSQIQARVQAICESVPSHRPFIFNLGHGLMPDIPTDAVQWVVDAVRAYQRPVVTV